MRFDILTIFPEFFVSPLSQSIVKRAQEKGIIAVRVINLRDFATDRHQVVDDRPFGGGPGMVMKIEPVAAAVTAAREEDPQVRVILLSPQGRRFTQAVARKLSEAGHLLLICGHYEGVDDRVQACIDEEISLGDYVLTGGEIPALAVVDAVTRLLPGVLGDAESVQEESFQEGLLEYPHYTRPRVFGGQEVPEILLSGDHGQIARWRRRQALRRTWERRPELLAEARLTPEEAAYVESLEENRHARREYKA